MGTITNAERHRLARLYGMSPADLGCRDEPAPIALSHVGTEGEPELKNWLALRRSAGCPPPTAAELAGWYSLQKRIAVNPENLPMAKRGAVDLSEYTAPAADAHAQQLNDLKSNAIRLLRKFVSDNPAIGRAELVAEIARQLTEFSMAHPGSVSAADLRTLPTEIVTTALKAMPDSSGNVKLSRFSASKHADGIVRCDDGRCPVCYSTL
jgi:outer membrane PBP1 activator LpoA protein